MTKTPRDIDSIPTTVAPAAELIISNPLTHHYRNPLSFRKVIAIRRNHRITICPRDRGHVSRPLPGHQFDLGLFKLAGENRRQKSRETVLDANLALQSRVQERQLFRGLSGQRLNHGARKELE